MKLDKASAENLRNDYNITFFPKVHGTIQIAGNDARLEKFTQHLPGKFMPLGAYSYTQSFFLHVARIGRYCSIGKNVSVMGNSHPQTWVSSSPIFYRSKRAKMWQSERNLFPVFADMGDTISIDDDVWVGDDVLLAHGVKLGTGSIIAARSIVTRDVPPYAIVGGSPARLLRWRFNANIIDALMASRWWDWPVTVWDDIDPRNISEFLKKTEIASKFIPAMRETRASIKDILSSIGIARTY